MPYRNPAPLTDTVSHAVLLHFVSTFADARPQRSRYEAQANFSIPDLSDKDPLQLECGQGPASRLATPSPANERVCSNNRSPVTVRTTNYPGSQVFSNEQDDTLATRYHRLSVIPPSMRFRF